MKSYKIIALILALIFCLSPLASCSGGDSEVTTEGGVESLIPEDTAPENNPADKFLSDGEPVYTIVRPLDPTLLESGMGKKLMDDLFAIFGVKFALETDYDGKKDNSARFEILIGKTNRAESIKAEAEISENGGYVMTDIIVIGGGPAGLTAAMYALRGGKSVMLFEKEAYGGQISKSALVENYPSVKAVSGFEMSMNLYNQAKTFGCEFRKEKVLSVADGEIKKVITSKGEYECRNVIFAVGASPRKSGLPNEDALVGRGLSYCAHCDGNFFRNKDVAVVGGGNTAVQDAIYLSEICSKVYLIHRRDTLRATKIYHEPLMKAENVEFKWNSTVEELIFDKKIEGVKIKNVLSGEAEEISLDGLFISIGRKPETKLFEGQTELDKNGYIMADESTRTNIDGVFAAGDVRTKVLRQVVTAAADGAVAVHYAEEYLAENQ